MGLLSLVGGIANFLFIAVEKVKKAVVMVKDLIMQAFFTSAQIMMQTVINKIESRIIGTLEGSAHAIRATGDTYQEVTRNYSVDEELGDWHEVVVTRKFTQQLPAAYQGLADGEEKNDTRELDEALVMEV